MINGNLKQRFNAKRFSYRPRGQARNCKIHTLTPESPGIRVSVVSPKTKIKFGKPIQTVYIMKKWQDELVTKACVQLINYIKDKYKVTVVLDSSLSTLQGIGECQFVKENEENKFKNVDIIILLGGDGTLLHLNSRLQDERFLIPPIVGFAMGSLGFLIPYSFIDHQETLKHIFSPKPLDVVLRTRLDCHVYDSSNKFLTSYQVLNEVLVNKGNSPFLSKLELFVDDVLATIVQADGLIISTASGSTAYSLSTGGPMLPPTVPAIVVAPICPHTLSFRPLVLPDSAQITVRCSADSRSQAFIHFDGRNTYELEKGGYIIVKTSSIPVPTICLDDPLEEWFRSITKRLNWNNRKLQKGLEDIEVPTKPSGDSKL
jgi:NAD+ kinase